MHIHDKEDSAQEQAFSDVRNPEEGDNGVGIVFREIGGHPARRSLRVPMPPLPVHSPIPSL